ncbi:PE domain-containing protein [Streptomyces sp. NPDC052811]
MDQAWEAAAFASSLLWPAARDEASAAAAALFAASAEWRA